MHGIEPLPFGPDLKVLVLAGSDPRTPVGRAHRRLRGAEVPLHHKAFLQLRGRLVVEYVLDWLRDAGLQRIWVLGPREHLARIPSHHAFVPILQRPGARMFANLSAARAALEPEPDEPVLVVFGDHPLTTPAALRSFLAHCRESIDSADFFHAVSLQTSYRAFARWFRRTSVHLREMSGRASGLNLAVPSRLHRLPALDEMYQVRKLEQADSLLGLVWRTVRWLGPSSPAFARDGLMLFLAKEAERRAPEDRGGWPARLERWLANRVPAARLENYVARIMGAERGVRLVPIPHGGLAIDVDFADELTVMERDWTALTELCERQDAELTSAGPRSVADDELPGVESAVAE